VRTMRKELIPLSRFVSYVLRHRPDEAGLSLEKGGWVSVNLLIDGINSHRKRKRASDYRSPDLLTRELLEEIVETNNKKRFEYNDSGSKIRASQGHSINIDLDLEEVEPPETLYHGTASKVVGKIMKGGLCKMKRHHVHLSSDAETAKQVGLRHGFPVVLEIGAKEMSKSGYKFYKSANGVWLTDHVPAGFIWRKR